VTSGAQGNRRSAAKRTQLPEEVAAYVRDLITSGQARPGEFLRIEPIADVLGISQTPVREGLLSLRSEGLVRLLPRRGFVVAPIAPEDIADLYWAQAVFAGELAARAAEKITDDEISQLDANVKQYARAVDAGDWEMLPEIGMDFHREVYRAAHSPRLVLILDSVTASLPNRSYSASNPKHTRQEHPRLLKAFRQRHPELARDLMTKHMTAQGERLIEILKERGFWSMDEKSDES